ncbi:MAG: CAP domain-containing protein [Acidimicrobiales bacterium]
MKAIPASCTPFGGTAPSRARRAAIVAVALVLATLVLPLRPASADVAFNQRMLELVNRERAAHGVPALVADPALSASAEDAPYHGCGFPVAGRAKDMGQRNYFSHSILGCGTQSVFNILNSLTGLVLSGAAENIAWMNGTTDPLVAAENLHSQLMNSPGHRANILNASFTKVGIGSWRTSPGQTWSGGGFALPNVFLGVQIFAGGPVDAPTTTAPPPPPGPTGRFTPLTPVRILDTRTGTGGFTTPVGPGGTIDVEIAGRGGIPTTDVAGVAMTVTVTQPTATGYLTLYPSGTARPAPSNVNFDPGETMSNLAVVKVGSNGKVSLFNATGTTHVIIDAAGWYSGSAAGNAGRFEPLPPSRILDTRLGVGGAVRLAPGASVDVQVAGRGGVPSAGAMAAVMNVTATGTAADGYLTVYPTGEARPWASNLNVTAGDTVATRAMVKLGSGGRVTVYNGAGATDVIVDVGGWYTDASVAGTLGAYVPVTPARVLDTRLGIGGFSTPVAGGTAVDVQVAGQGGVPATGARAVILNATVTQPGGEGYLSLFPAGTAQPNASDVNFAAGDTQPNLVVVQLGAGGKVRLFSSATTHAIFDVAGWIS